MPSRIIIGGRVLGSGKYGTDAKCLCGEPVSVLGRCAACHDALRRRRLGLEPANAAESKRLGAYLQKYEAAFGRCRGICGIDGRVCGRTLEEGHRPTCEYDEE